MEQLLHYCWKHKLFPLAPLTTVSGARVEVIDPGLHNRNSGPDFFNAKVKIDGTLWVGNVEIHDRASDWFRHGHDRDSAYDNVVLHVCGTIDGDAVATVPTTMWCSTSVAPSTATLLPIVATARRKCNSTFLSR